MGKKDGALPLLEISASGKTLQNSQLPNLSPACALQERHMNTKLMDRTTFLKPASRSWSLTLTSLSLCESIPALSCNFRCLHRVDCSPGKPVLICMLNIGSFAWFSGHNI